MKKFTKLFAIAVISFAAFAASAQSSKRSGATMGLFSTEVDCFMDLIDWSTVKPENVFAYIGYSDSMAEVGFAKQFKPFFLGLYTKGAINSFDLSSSTTITNSGDKTVANANQWDKTQGEFKFDSLLGFDNMAFSLGLSYNPNGSTNDTSSKPSTGDKTSTNDDDFYLAIKGSWGMSMDKMSVYAGGSYVVDADKTVTKSGDDSHVTDNSSNTIIVNGGVILPLKGNKTFEQTFDVSGHSSVTFYPKYSEITVTGGNKTPVENDSKFDMEIGAIPRYTATFTPNEKLSVKARGGAYVEASFGKSAVSAANTENNSTVFNVIPYAAAAISYAVKPEFLLNAGVSFSLPYAELSFTNVKNTATESKTSGVEFAYNKGSFATSWSSGFTYTIAKNITIDFTYDVLGDLLNSNFGSKNLSNTDNILTTINKVLVHSFSFGVSAKL